MNNFKRHQEVSNAQREQKLRNAVKLIAYAAGQTQGGYPCKASGHIGGFSNDYVFIHDNPANAALHPVHTVYISKEDLNKEDERWVKEHLDAIEQEFSKRPRLQLLDDETLAECRRTIKQLWQEDEAAFEKWLETWINKDPLDAGLNSLDNEYLTNICFKEI